MLIDHTGVILFPQISILRTIGRLAFPLFAYQIGVGYKGTSNFKKYLGRLSLLAFIAQIPYSIIYPHELNIIFTLILGLILIYFYDQKQYYLLPLALAIPFIANIDYGIYGLLLVLLFYIFQEQPWKLVVSYVALLIPFFSTIQPFSLLALPIILGQWKTKLKIPRYSFYIFYPVHLIILLIIKFSCF